MRYAPITLLTITISICHLAGDFTLSDISEHSFLGGGGPEEFRGGPKKYYMKGGGSCFSES